jgi:hypothetical protein
VVDTIGVTPDWLTKIAMQLSLPDHRQSKALVLCFSVLLGGVVQDVRAMSVALHLRGTQSARSQDFTLATDIEHLMPEGIDVDVTNKSLPKVKESPKCLCPLTKFWHWRLASCIDQGPWGYECGFFPIEHHHRVCQDLLKCEQLNKGNTSSAYHPFGDSKKAQSVPASCNRCGQQDSCLQGKARQDKECLKQYSIEGKEACVNVKVTTYHSAVAEATASYTASESVTKSANANAKASATHTETATAKSKAEAAHEAVVTVTEDALASATASSTASADSTAKKTATEKATAESTAKSSATASDTHTANEEVTKEKTYGAEEAGIKVSAKDKATASSEATESASATAEVSKTKKATSSATKSAEASAKATETAKVSSEASASKSATAKGKASASVEVESSAQGTGSATESASATASHTENVEKTATSTAKVVAKETGVAENKGCATVEEAMKELGFDKDQKLGAVLSAKVIATAEKIAYERALKFAVEEAKEKGLLSAQSSAEELAQAEANEKAMQKATAMASGDVRLCRRPSPQDEDDARRSVATTRCAARSR